MAYIISWVLLFQTQKTFLAPNCWFSFLLSLLKHSVLDRSKFYPKKKSLSKPNFDYFRHNEQTTFFCLNESNHLLQVFTFLGPKLKINVLFFLATLETFCTFNSLRSTPLKKKTEVVSGPSFLWAKTQTKRLNFTLTGLFGSLWLVSCGFFKEIFIKLVTNN